MKNSLIENANSKVSALQASAAAERIDFILDC